MKPVQEWGKEGVEENLTGRNEWRDKRIPGKGKAEVLRNFNMNQEKHEQETSSGRKRKDFRSKNG